MDRIVSKTDPRLFDYEVLKIQKALADDLPWLDHAIGICETLTSIKEGKKFVSANLYKGKGQYELIMPCDELGNFSFFVLKDPQEIRRDLIKSPFSLIVWYDTRKVSLPYDERNTEQIKGQIIGLLNASHMSNVEMTKVYENPKSIFAEYTYDFVANQHLMSPYAGLRIDGMISARIPCVKRRIDFFGSYNKSYNLSFDK